MGIADIQRGQTDPNETLGAQIIKSNNAAGRLKTMQNHVVQFATTLLNIKAQIICNHFSEDTIIKISGADQLSDNDKQLVPQALALLKSESAKNFRIDVTSDSMIYQDEQQEKADRMAFLQAMGQFFQQAVPMATAVPETTPMLMEMLKFAVTSFKAGKQLEGIIDETADKFREQAKAAEGQPKPPSPEMQKLQMQSQLEQQKMQFQGQLEQQKMQANIEFERAKQEYQSQETQVRMQMEAERDEREADMQIKVKQMEIDAQTQKEVLLSYLDNATKIETARIGAGFGTGEQAYVDNVEAARIMQDTMGYSDMRNHPLQPVVENMNQSNQQMTQLLAALIDQLQQQHSKPKTVIRDENGKIVGVQ
jgi:hypothetical protein